MLGSDYEVPSEGVTIPNQKGSEYEFHNFRDIEADLSMKHNSNLSPKSIFEVYPDAERPNRNALEITEKL